MFQQQADLHTMPQLTTCILWDLGKWFIVSYPQFPHLQRSVCHKGELKKNVYEEPRKGDIQNI